MVSKLNALRTTICGAVLTVAALGGGAAKAIPLDFTIYAPGATGSWTMDSNTTPVYFSNYSTSVNIQNGAGIFSSITNIKLNSVDSGNPGLFAEGGDDWFSGKGSVIFSGLPSAPQFSVGTFQFLESNYYHYDPISGEGYNGIGSATLVVSDPNAVANSGPVGGGPGAPAPLIGGGLLSALAALAALALTRLRSRSFLVA